MTAPQRKRFSQDQIKLILSEASKGTAIAELSKKYGVSGTTIYKWKEKHGRSSRRPSSNGGTRFLRVSDLKNGGHAGSFKLMKEENERLKHLIQELQEQVVRATLRP